ncbi:MAG: hypothetical protein ABIG42_05925 [bacterium]
MKIRFRKITICFIVIFLLFPLSSYSSSPKTIKPDTKSKSSVTDVPLIQRESKTFDFKKMEFPLSDNLETVCSWLSVVPFFHDIKLYRDVNGSFPDSFSTLVKSGFLLKWPRNPITGKPVEVVTGRDLIKDRSDFGSFKYEIINDSEFRLRYINLDRDYYLSTGEESWKEYAPTYEYHPEIVHRRYDKQDEGTKMKRWAMNVMGIQKKLEEFEDDDKKLLCAMVGNLESIVNSSTNRHYTSNEVLPESFFDVLDNRDFIIKENFVVFARMLKDSGASFKWGFDGNIRYFELIINGETYIKQCVTYDSVDEFRSTGGLTFECLTDKSMFDSLDKSSPIITSENLIDVVIPEEYLISIEDIPLGDD